MTKMTTRPLTADERIQEVVCHEPDCNAGLHDDEAVKASQAEYDWRVVEPYDGRPWMSWEMLGYDLKNERHKAEWTYCADLSHAFTGLVRLKPGQRQPTHTHTTPEVYYILQGKPIVTLNNISNRTSPWQCVSIPSECPHSVTNDTEEEVVIAWIYVSLKDKVNPNENYNWTWLEELF